MEELAQGLLARGVGIVQMACPELSLFGLDRGNLPINELLQKAECQPPLCRLASEIANQIEQYRSCGVHVLGILGKNGSPTCGVEQTWKKGVVRGSGVFIEKLRLELEARNLPVNIKGYCDSEPGQALDAIDHWLTKHR